MHIITRKRLNEFVARFPETNNALADWYRQMKENNFASIEKIRAIFPSADKVGKRHAVGVLLVAYMNINRIKHIDSF